MRYLHIYFVCAKLFAMDNSANYFHVKAKAPLKSRWALKWELVWRIIQVRICLRIQSAILQSFLHSAREVAL